MKKRGTDRNTRWNKNGNEREKERGSCAKKLGFCSFMTYRLQISPPPLGTPNLQFYPKQLLWKEMHELAGWILHTRWTRKTPYENRFQFNSVAQSCPTPCDPMKHSMPGLPVHHQLPESTQTHVHWVSDAIQSSHPLSSPSFLPQSFPTSGSFQMSQYFKSGGQSIVVSGSASVLPMNTQDWSPLRWTGWISLQSKGLSGVFFNITVQKHQFFGTQLSL